MTRHQAVQRWLDDATWKIGDTHMEIWLAWRQLAAPAPPAGRQPPGQAGASAAHGTDPGRLRMPWQAALPHPSDINFIQKNQDHLLTIVDYMEGDAYDASRRQQRPPPARRTRGPDRALAAGVSP